MKTVSQLREEIMARSLTDSGFRQRLVGDPAGVLRDDFGVSVPDGFTLHIHENSADAGHIVLPPAELSEEQLAELSAGCDGSGKYMFDC